MAEAAPAAEESAAAPSALATPMAVPQSTPAPNGCALSFVQGNSSYSKFQEILNAAPYTSNFSSVHSSPTCWRSLSPAKPLHVVNHDVQMNQLPC